MLQQLRVVELAVEDAELDVARAAELVVDTCAGSLRDPRAGAQWRLVKRRDEYRSEDARWTSGEDGAPTTTTQPAASMLERTIMLL